MERTQGYAPLTRIQTAAPQGYAQPALGIGALYRAPSGTGANTWGTANVASYQPLVVLMPIRVVKVGWPNGTTSGTRKIDVGLYDMSGNRLFSIGQTTQSGSAAMQFVTLANPYTIAPGSYYAAMACDNGSTSLTGGFANSTERGRFRGCLRQTSAATLPATATFAACTTTSDYIPNIYFVVSTAL